MLPVYTTAHKRFLISRVIYYVGGFNKHKFKKKKSNYSCQIKTNYLSMPMCLYDGTLPEDLFPGHSISNQDRPSALPKFGHI